MEGHEKHKKKKKKVLIRFKEIKSNFERTVIYWSSSEASHTPSIGLSHNFTSPDLKL